MGMSDVCTTGWYGVLTYYESFEKINKFQYKSYFVTQGTIGDALFYSDTQVTLLDRTYTLKLTLVIYSYFLLTTVKQ